MKLPPLPTHLVRTVAVWSITVFRPANQGPAGITMADAPRSVSFTVAALAILVTAAFGANSTAASNVPRPEPDIPFVFGAQYYRAPTPARDQWEKDMKRMAELGFTDVKLWLQWRWGHPAPDKYYFEDLDDLMGIADRHGLRVTLNAIFDVAPVWLYEKYPDAKQVMNNGRMVEPYTVQHRQIGGHPGPCYSHPGALAERQVFFKKAILHLKKHKNLAMWDVWNEPELCFPQRDGELERLACYCPHCHSAFVQWLKSKYETITTLNSIWGRNYLRWEDVEMPRNGATVKDFVDWREFHGDVMVAEAKWRLALAKELDPPRIAYLHVVPNTMQPFNAVSTCMDDFEVSQDCDVFAATMNSGPFFTPQVVSAARGKISYNVESHINGGGITMYQKPVDLNDLLNDFLPQVGMGIKGFMFWQYRPELLGAEAPAWGLVNPDGSDREVTRAAATFWAKLRPHADTLMKSRAALPQVAIWKSQKNEIFHYCMFNTVKHSLPISVNAYATWLYNNNYAYCFVDSDLLTDLAGIKVLIMPSCYYLTQAEADAIQRWVRGGGVLLNEAHLGAYNDDTGRHSTITPGLGLDRQFGIREVDATSTYRLRMARGEKVEMALAPDVVKMLNDFGATGGKYVPIILEDGSVVWGATRFARIEAPDAAPLGRFSQGLPTIVRKNVGTGTIFYCGTNLGEGSEKSQEGFGKLLNQVLATGSVSPTLGSSERDVRIETLSGANGLNYIIIRNLSGTSRNVKVDFEGTASGLFSGQTLAPATATAIPGGFCDIFSVQH